MSSQPPQSLESMTGYGHGEAEVSGPNAAARIIADVRSVNHRHLDIRSRTDDALVDTLHIAEEVVRKHVRRGRVDLRLRIEGIISAPPVLDRIKAEAAMAQLRAVRDELAPEEPVPLTLLGAVPDLFIAGDPEVEGIQNAVVDAVENACGELLAMRRREGAASIQELRRLTDIGRAECAALRQRVPALVADSRIRLKARLERLLDRHTLDPNRLEQEVAILADRSDIQEELSRLTSHLDHFEESLAHKEPQGRRLDFLLQEMVRETNTVGSKVQDATVTLMVVKLKSVFEALREQVQNVV